MSAFRPKADVNQRCPELPFIANSGHASHCAASTQSSNLPVLPDAHHYDVHVWEHGKFEDWVEAAATEWKIYARPEPLTKPGT